MADETNTSVDSSREEAIFNKHNAAKHVNLLLWKTRHGYIHVVAAHFHDIHVRLGSMVPKRIGSGHERGIM